MKYETVIIEYCKIPRTRIEIMNHLKIGSRWYFHEILKPLLETNKIYLTIPDKPTSKNQKYLTNPKLYQEKNIEKEKEVVR